MHLVQIGNSMDGLRPYAKAARDRAMKSTLIYSDEARYQRGQLLGEPSFDRVIKLKTLALETLLPTLNQLQEPIDLIVAGNELTTVLTAQLCETIGLPTIGADTVKKFRYKSVQRQAMVEAGLGYLQPKFHACRTHQDLKYALENLDFPVIIKPDDSGGSMGVTVVNTQEEAQEAFDALQGLTLDNGEPSTGVILVEECVDGKEFAIEGIVDAEGNATILTATQKTLSGVMEQGLINCPADTLDSTAKQAAEEIVSALGLRQSPFQMDLRVSSDGKPKLIECGARLSGAFITRPFEKATGYSWASIAIDIMLGKPLSWQPRRYYSGLTFITPKNIGRLGAYNITLSDLGVGEEEEVSLILFCPERELGGSYRHVSDRLGFVQATARSEQRVRELLHQIVPQVDPRCT